MESLNRLFDILSRERRRYALYALDRADGPVEIEELAERIRQWEEDGEPVSTGGLDDVVLSLQHTHLPRAAEAEYIEFDREEKEIRVSGEPAEFQMILAVSEAIENTDPTRVLDPETTAPEDLLSRLTPTSETGD